MDNDKKISWVHIIETLGSVKTLESDANRAIEREQARGWSVRSAVLSTQWMDFRDEGPCVVKYITIVFEQKIPAQ